MSNYENGYEKQLTTKEKDIPNTHITVNNIYLNGVRVVALTSCGKTQLY